MRREFYSAEQPADDEPQAESRYCVAAACPLPGAISESMKGGGPWMCRHHFGAPSVRWPEITDELKRMKRDGELDGPRPETKTVAEMRERLRK